MLTEPSGSRQQSARTRGVVISPVVDLTVRDTEMVEVRSDDDITIRMLTALHIPHDVGHLLHVTLSAGMAMVKWLLPAAVKRAQPGGFKMPADVCSRFPTPFTPGEAPLQFIRGQILHMPQQLFPIYHSSLIGRRRISHRTGVQEHQKQE